jgi:hypothetical protein
MDTRPAERIATSAFPGAPPVFAVFAVFAGNYQRVTSLRRRNPGVPAARPSKEQRAGVL